MMAVYRFIQFFFFSFFSAILEECKYTQDRIDVVLQLYQVCLKKKSTDIHSNLSCVSFQGPFR